MSVRRRLERVEAERGGRGCVCPNTFEVRYYPGLASVADAERDTTPAIACQTCGEPRTLLKVVYTDKWHGGGA